MSQLDPATTASVAALVVACVAMLIATAQVLQQYFVTGQLIRLCDSVVFGPMPGQGRRIWQLSQFRFRVIYSIPQISLDTDLWAETSCPKSYAIGKHELPDLAAVDPRVHSSVLVDSRLISSQQKKRLSRSFSFPWASARTYYEEDSEDGVGTNRLRRRFPSSQSSMSSSRHRSDIRRVVSHPKENPESCHQVGEASWVSFCRAIERCCGHSVRYDFVQYDADRCPSDLVSAPMQVSMKDIIVMGLMAGMEITRASFNERSVFMQGEIGTLTSSTHPVLGPILHFTPRTIYELRPGAFGFGLSSYRHAVQGHWLNRTLGVCSVAHKYFGPTARRTMRRLDDRWIRNQRDEWGYNWGTDIALRGNHANAHTDLEEKSTLGTKFVNDPTRVKTIPRRLLQDGLWLINTPPGLEIVSKPQVEQPAGREEGAKKAQLEGDSPEAKGKGILSDELDATLGVSTGSTQEGAPAIDTERMTRPQRQATVEDALDDEDVHLAHDANAKLDDYDRFSGRLRESPTLYPDIRRHSTLEDTLEESQHQYTGSVKSLRNGLRHTPGSLDRVQTAKALQAARAEKLRKVQRDKELVEDSVKRGAISSPYELESRSGTQPFALTWNGNRRGTNDSDEVSLVSIIIPTNEEEEARKRELDRTQRLRAQRDHARDERNAKRNRASRLTAIDMFWISQMDISRGFWATPWHDSYTTPIYSSLVGAVTVVLEALLGFLDKDSLCYIEGGPRMLEEFKTTAIWMFCGNCTYPGYAHNARGGVIAAGSYTGVRIPAFESVIPALELLYSYDWQVEKYIRDQMTYVDEQNVELMRLDAWLSYVGRTDEISTGPHHLLKSTPALIQHLIDEFEIDFQNIDLSAEEGGLQDIQGLAANVMDFLTDEELNEAEQLYVLIALLRAVKAAQCLRAGPNTGEALEILSRDVQAHLV